MNERKELPCILSTQSKVRFQDCDPYGHLNNSNYISYFLNHREDALKEDYDFDLFRLAKEKGRTWLVAQNQIIYFQPAFVMESIYIESQLIGLRSKVLEVEMRMYDQSGDKMKALLWSSFVHFDLKASKSIEHHPDDENLFKSVLKPVDQKTFEDRAGFLRRSLRPV